MATALAATHGQPHLPQLLCRFLYDQLYGQLLPSNINLPELHENIHVHRSAVATFYAPSDLSGIGGMWREWIRAVPAWHEGPGRYDCLFVVTNESLKGMRGLMIACIQLFLSFQHHGTTYPCALVHWYSYIGDKPDENTGMWIVVLDFCNNGTPFKGSSISTASYKLQISLGSTEMHSSLNAWLSMTH